MRGHKNRKFNPSESGGMARTGGICRITHKNCRLDQQNPDHRPTNFDQRLFGSFVDVTDRPDTDRRSFFGRVDTNPSFEPRAIALSCPFVTENAYWFAESAKFSPNPPKPRITRSPDLPEVPEMPDFADLPEIPDQIRQSAKNSRVGERE